ncbi:hypothetical protein BJ138DRAFT_1163128, partial [Hygrophoropsis aurantiaca]
FFGEGRLKNTFWKDMIGHGSMMHQFRDSQESAWKIVDMIVVVEPLDALQIQKELVDLHKILPETDAGNSMRIALNELIEMIETHKKTVMQLQNADGLQEDEDLQRKLQDTETKLYALLKQIQEMKIPLGKRLTGFLGNSACYDKSSFVGGFVVTHAVETSLLQRTSKKNR